MHAVGASRGSEVHAVSASRGSAVHAVGASRGSVVLLWVPHVSARCILWCLTWQRGACCWCITCQRGGCCGCLTRQRSACCGFLTCQRGAYCGDSLASAVDAVGAAQGAFWTTGNIITILSLEMSDCSTTIAGELFALPRVYALISPDWCWMSSTVWIQLAAPAPVLKLQFISDVLESLEVAGLELMFMFELEHQTCCKYTDKTI